MFNCSTTGSELEYWDERVCLCVCPRTSPDFSPNLVCVLLVAVAWSSSDGHLIRYVLPVLWTTSCFRMMGGVKQPQQRRCNVVYRLTPP